MKTMEVLFPNLILEHPCTLWGINFTGFSMPSAKAPSELRALAVWEYESENEEKAVMRQLKVLRCHLMLSAYLTGKNPLIICKMLFCQKEGDGQAAAFDEMRVPLSSLASILPQKLEESAATVCWFAQYLEQPSENERTRVFRLYNALGTLPGGFDGISVISSKREDKAVLERLLCRIETFHAEDDERENVSMSRPLTITELKILEDCYLRCLTEVYLQFGQ